MFNKIQTRHIQRLKKFAEYIEPISHQLYMLDPQLIVFIDNDLQKGYQATYHSFVFQDTPWIHFGWQFISDLPLKIRDYNTNEIEWVEVAANPVYRTVTHGSPQDPFKAGTVNSVIYYYGLTPEIFLHLFGADSWSQQISKYGGIIYPKEVSAKHIVQNINQLIDLIMKEKKQEQHNLLLKFADFLDGQKDPEDKEIATFDLIDNSSGINIRVSLTCLYWLFSFLPDVFYDEPNDWYIDSHSGEVISGPSEGGDTISSVFTFFNLQNVIEFKELFCVNDNLAIGSSCKEIAANIIIWVRKQS